MCGLSADGGESQTGEGAIATGVAATACGQGANATGTFTTATGGAAIASAATPPNWIAAFAGDDMLLKLS